MRSGSGLAVSSVLDRAGEELQELIQFSTFPSVTARYETVGDCLEQLDKVEDKLTAPEKDTVDNSLDARVGDKLECGFVVRGRLGSGSAAVVLLVEKDAKEFVLKLSTHPDHNDRLRDEAELLRKLHHQNIVTVLESAEMNGLVGFTMERAGEKTLAQRLRSEGRLPLDLLERFGEELVRLRSLRVQTFVSHSSLSADERGRAEQAFSTGSDCVIVATSTLELGIDVGDPDRVVQIDTPPTVSSFLQRMGRTGRRHGVTRNCLFLATSRSALIRAAGLIELWSSGYVEPIEPPAMPFHLFAQQLMALALQQGGIGRRVWREWIGRMPAFGQMTEEETTSIMAHMLANGLFAEDEGVLWFGRKGEEEFGRKNFMELLSVFQSPPLFSVKHGQIDLGEVHESSFLIRTGEATSIAPRRPELGSNEH